MSEPTLTSCLGVVCLPIIAADRLVSFVRDIFIAAGTPVAHADRVAQSLVRSNLVGHDSHGVIRVPQYLTVRKP